MSFCEFDKARHVPLGESRFFFLVRLCCRTKLSQKRLQPSKDVKSLLTLAVVVFQPHFELDRLERR